MKAVPAAEVTGFTGRRTSFEVQIDVLVNITSESCPNLYSKVEARMPF